LTSYKYPAILIVISNFIIVIIIIIDVTKEPPEGRWKGTSLNGKHWELLLQASDLEEDE